jgi:hypothetical protein
MNMKVHGRCHCGAVRYEADVDPTRVQVCHCTDCQQFSGAPSRVSVPAPKESFRFVAGTPRIYIKTAESGNKRAQAFCENCGSPVYSAAVDNPPAYSLRVGCREERDSLPPQKQIWCDSAIEWAMDIEELPQTARQ